MASPTDIGHDQRRHPRVALNLLVQFRSQSYEEFVSDYATNLSTGGIFISTQRPHPLGTQLHVQFLSEGNSLVAGLAEWCE